MQTRPNAQRRNGLGVLLERAGAAQIRARSLIVVT